MADQATVKGHRHMLDHVEWRYVSTRLEALGVEFGIRSNDEELGGYLGSLFEALAVPGSPTHLYSVIDRPEMESRYEVYFDDVHLVSATTAAGVLRRLQWDVNERVIASNRAYLLVHAAAAADARGLGIVLPAAMDSGKTTLVSGLVRAGLRYLSDEAAAIDPRTGHLHPYAKALTIDEGSWEVLGDLRPKLPPTLAPFASEQWYVPANTIRPDAVSPAARPALVVAPQYVRDGETELEPISRARALQILVENAFNFRLFPGQAALSVLGELVSGAECYRLRVANLTEACDLLLGLFAELRDGGGGMTE